MPSGFSLDFSPKLFRDAFSLCNVSVISSLSLSVAYASGNAFGSSFKLPSISYPFCNSNGSLEILGIISDGIFKAITDGIEKRIADEI